MKSLAICLLVLGIGLVGCSKGPRGGWHCPDCENPIAERAMRCPNCSGVGNLDNLYHERNLQTLDEWEELKEECLRRGITRWNKN
jgi:hypothetical protein